MPPKKVTVADVAVVNSEDADIANKYRKMSQRDHCLARSGMYIGSINVERTDFWVYDDGESRMVKRPIDFIPGLNKIFDEVISNAIDHIVRQKQAKAAAMGKDSESAAMIQLVKNIKVKLDRETGVVECFNDGNGIDVVLHPEHAVYVPQLIFGELLTSTNYNDDEERVTSGTNGLGVKQANIFSEFFEIETVDHVRKQLYVQRWEQNMGVAQPPKITRCVKKPYTIIRFKPDYARFGLEGGRLSDDMYKVFERRVYDACAVTDTDINIFLNDRKLEYKSFEKYVDIFLGPKDKHERVYERINDGWEVVASYSDFAGFQQVSFVNGVCTFKGGKHVDCVLNQIVKRLTEMINKKKKDAIVKPTSIKDNLMLFIKCSVVNPTFDSQSKESLTTPIAKFGGKVELSDKFIDKLFKTELSNKILNICDSNMVKEAKKTDGRKTSVIRGIENLDDANWAGTAKSAECTLILTEGLSAKTMAIAGLSVIGRDKYGVFPLRGKLLNVKDVTPKKILENEEISNLKKIIGLESGKVYKSTSELRYGKILILTDADTDGAHIRQLIVNLFHTLWPSLIINDGFIQVMLTPIIRATHKNNKVMLFYSFNDFVNWKDGSAEANDKGWNFKYLKGLGSSKEKDAKEYFKSMRTLLYKWNGKESDDALDLAFNKKRADDRKEWLENYDKTLSLDYGIQDVTYEDAINRELIHFSNYDLSRSIPSVVDGLKTSQRKVLFSCFKRGLYNEIKVAQLAGYVSEVSGYHHGEQSLNMTIVGMAQDYVGSNNINVLRPNGQFGSRVHSGSDAASPRYIYTHLFDINKVLFKKEDMGLLAYLEDDDKNPIEPEWYCPVVPMVLVNGALGIGTGYSTNVPSYNPKDIIAAIRARLKAIDNGSTDGYDRPELVPWYRGFKGSVVKTGNDKYMSVGCASVEGPCKVVVTELPVGYATIDFKNDLEDFADKCPDVKNVEAHYTPREVRFVINFVSEVAVKKHMALNDTTGMPQLYTTLKLTNTRNFSTSNMYLFNEKSQIKKYKDAHEIIDNHFAVRMEYYEKRREYLAQALTRDLETLEPKLRFVRGIINDEFSIYKKARGEIEELLVSLEFPKIDDGYDYLLKMQIYTLTDEKVVALEKEIAETYARLNEIMSTSSSAMWLRELDEFETAYDKYMVEWEMEVKSESDGGGEKKIKKVVKRN